MRALRVGLFLALPLVAAAGEPTAEKREGFRGRGDEKLMPAAEPLHERACPRRVSAAFATEADRDPGHATGSAESRGEPCRPHVGTVFVAPAARRQL